MKFLSLLAVCTAAFAADGATTADWPHYGGTYASLRYSALDQINTSNVKSLAPAWVFQTGDYENGLQATPMAATQPCQPSPANRGQLGHPRVHALVNPRVDLLQEGINDRIAVKRAKLLMDLCRCAEILRRHSRRAHRTRVATAAFGTVETRATEVDSLPSFRRP